MADSSRPLSDIAAQVRSKNAGPFWLTFDIFFRSEADYEWVVSSGSISPDSVAALYGVEPNDVRVFELPSLNVLKVSFPRAVVAGSPDDSDLHAGQQFVPLSQIRIPTVVAPGI